MEQQSYYQRNKEKILEKARIYRETHREILNEKSKKYQAEHKEERGKYKKKYYKEHSEKLKEKTKKWKKDNSLRWLTSRKIRVYNIMDSKKGFDISNNITPEWMEENIIKEGNKCLYCGEEDYQKLGCDRIDNSKPHIAENIVCACYACNIEREARKKNVEEFIEYKKATKIVEKLIKENKLEDFLKKYLE